MTANKLGPEKLREYAKIMPSPSLAEMADAWQADRERILELEKEVYTLRQYGNKYCTAMADEALENGD